MHNNIIILYIIIPNVQPGRGGAHQVSVGVRGVVHKRPIVPLDLSQPPDGVPPRGPCTTAVVVVDHTGGGGGGVAKKQSKS